MVRSVSVLVAIFSCAAMPSAVACTPSPEAFLTPPRTETSEFRLPDRSPESALVHAAGRYEIRVRPVDLLEAIKSTWSGPMRDDTFGGRLAALPPLEADMAVREIFAPLAPEAPESDEKTLRRAEYNRFWRKADAELRYHLALLLESGRATVIEKSSGAALPVVIRHKRIEACYGTRRFVTPDGALVIEAHD